MESSGTYGGYSGYADGSTGYGSAGYSSAGYGIAGYGSAGGWQIYYSTPSDSEGNYSLSGLPTGKYRVYLLTDSTGMNYLPQYYPGVGSMDEAAVLEVNSAQTIENIDFNLSAGITLKGTVKDAVTGKPIPGIGCTVELLNEQGQGVKKAYTGATGDYQFTGLRSGTCFVMVTNCQNYYSAYYRQTDDQKPGSIVTLYSPITLSLPGPVEGIDILLSPMASISGRIVDEFDQKPLANITVTALVGIPAYYTWAVSPGYSESSGPVSYFYSQSAITDADGQYTLKGLNEGNYLIMASDRKHLYAIEYYKGVPLNQPEKADIIQVGMTGDTGGIDLALQVGETYTGDDTGSSVGSYPEYGISSYGGPSGLAYAIVDGDSSVIPSVPQWYVPSSADASKAIPAPQIVSSNSVEKITAGRTFTYQVKINDAAANTSLRYSLSYAPEGMDIDPDSGVVQWKPSNSHAGQTIVQVKVDNGSGQVASQSFRLGVEADTTPPEEITALTAAKGDRKVTISWTPSADSGGDLSDQILYVKEGDAPYSPGISLGKAAASYTVENLQNGKAYTFKIVTSDELANESSGVTVTATPAKEQAVNTVANQQTSGLNYFSPLNNASIVDLINWGVVIPLPWPTNGPGSWSSSSWTSLLWPDSNSPLSNSTSPFVLWNTSPAASLWGNYSTTSSGGISNSLWNSGWNLNWNSNVGPGNSFTNQ